MLFFPYKVDIDLNRLPVVTILICLICCGIYILQYSSERAVTNSALEFCKQKHQVKLNLVLERVVGHGDLLACVKLFSSLHNNSNPKNVISLLAERSGTISSLDFARSKILIVNTLSDNYTEFSRQAPSSLTAELMYDPQSLSLRRMILSVFAHGSWMHLIGNLFFFFAFAASVEIILGSITFLTVILILASSTNLIYSLTMFFQSRMVPTLGLSGVVMGMIGLFTFLIPTARIRCFFWFILIIRIFSIPAWILVLWYFGWDLYNLYFSQSEQSNVNLIAHVSGALLGLSMGFLFFRNRRPMLTSSKRLRRVS